MQGYLPSAPHDTLFSRSSRSIKPLSNHNTPLNNLSHINSDRAKSEILQCEEMIMTRYETQKLMNKVTNELNIAMRDI
jgi:hypothetical protein